MGNKVAANAEFVQTRNMTKAADDTVFKKLQSSRAKDKTDGAGTAPSPMGRP
jgi:hypothetical protein